jgi:hypothetical protein
MRDGHWKILTSAKIEKIKYGSAFRSFYVQKRILRIFYFNIISLIFTVFKLWCPAHLFPNTPRISYILYGSVAEAYTTQPNSKASSRVLYIYLACMAGWPLEQRDAFRRAAYVGPPRMRSNAVGGGGDCTFSLAWEGATMMPLQGSPQTSRSEA